MCRSGCKTCQYSLWFRLGNIGAQTCSGDHCKGDVILISAFFISVSVEETIGKACACGLLALKDGLNSNF